MLLGKDPILGWPVYRLRPFSPFSKEINRIFYFSTGQRANGTTG
jgi:hypothetical protein